MAQPRKPRGVSNDTDPALALSCALLVVRLVGGYTVTYGVWVGVHPDDLQRAFRVWWEPDYDNLRLGGGLANSVPP